MHYALPQRKSSQPAPYEVKPKKSLRQDRVLRILFVVSVLTLLFIIYRLLSHWFFYPRSGLTRAPYGYPNVVVVTTIDPEVEEEEPQLIENIKANRLEYAAKHGYATFFPSTEHYRKYMGDSPSSWARVPATRHALANFTHTPLFFHVDYKTIIMNMDVSIEQHIMDRKTLERNMLVDVPVIPPDSVIKTFGGIPGDKIDLVIAQDSDGLMPNAFILRRCEWAKFLLDAWFDPMYQSYNFQKAERHALEHIIQCAMFNYFRVTNFTGQEDFRLSHVVFPESTDDLRWHGTILAHIALVPQKVLTTYTEKDTKWAAPDGLYKDGDFTVFFGDCDNNSDRSCAQEMKPYFAKLFAKEKSDSET